LGAPVPNVLLFKKFDEGKNVLGKKIKNKNKKNKDKDKE